MPLRRKPGGALGPDLSEAGIVLSPESLRLAITNPSAEIARGYETVVAVPAAGKKVEGIALNEDDISIQMRTTDGNLRSFIKDDLRDLRREERSLMPSYASKLSAAEIDTLVEYLETLKGSSSRARHARPSDAGYCGNFGEPGVSGASRSK